MPLTPVYEFAVEFDKLAALVENASNIIAITGAGLSTESGLPDFRSRGGIWENVDPMQQVSLSAFKRDPALFWQFYHERLTWDGEFAPNDGHHALVELEKMGKLSGIITQNIDGFHQRAGSTRVIEIHGSPATWSCIECGAQYQRQEGERRADLDAFRVPRDDHGHPLKPDIILFEEQLPQSAHTAMAWCYDADLILALGTSLVVKPVSDWVLANRKSRPPRAGLNSPDEGDAADGKFAIVTASSTPKDHLAGAVVRAPLGETLAKLTKHLDKNMC